MREASYLRLLLQALSAYKKNSPGRGPGLRSLREENLAIFRGGIFYCFTIFFESTPPAE